MVRTMDPGDVVMVDGRVGASALRWDELAPELQALVGRRLATELGVAVEVLGLRLVDETGRELAPHTLTVGFERQAAL